MPAYYSFDIDEDSKDIILHVLKWNASISWSNVSEKDSKQIRTNINDAIYRTERRVPQYTEKKVLVIVECIDSFIYALSPISENSYRSNPVPHCRSKARCISYLRDIRQVFVDALARHGVSLTHERPHG